jgi:hypothetical protein
MKKKDVSVKFFRYLGIKSKLSGYEKLYRFINKLDQLKLKIDEFFRSKKLKKKNGLNKFTK